MSDVIDPHRFAASVCWFCRGPLPPTFTTIMRKGARVQVHLGCRLEAEAIAGHSVLIEEQPEAWLPIG